MGRTVCIISATPVTDEPRVLRQAAAMHAAGWDVTVVGYPGRQPPPPYWRFVQVGNDEPYLRIRYRILKVLEKDLASISSEFAERYYWRYAHWGAIYDHIANVAGVRCDLAIGHDSHTAPIAAKLARLSGGRFSVDCHEFSIEQYMHDPVWERQERPWIRSLDRRFLHGAAVVTTVCDGIADAYERAFWLRQRPTVVRSVARFHDLKPRPPGERLTVLYHGIVSPTRGLEEAIASVPSWRDEYRLVIRGPGEADYVRELRDRIFQYGVQGRATVEDGVLFNEMIPKANEADVGLFVQGGYSVQKRFTLPNKFFEYIQARLALCVSDLPEMAKIVNAHDLGVLVPRATPEDIATAINGLTRVRIAHHRAKSHAAAQVLSWENEAQTMLDAYDRATG